VIDVVVGEEHPTDVLRFDDGERVLQPLLAIRRSTGVDDDRFLAADHHGVEIHEQRMTERGLYLVDHENVVGRVSPWAERRWTVQSERMS